MQSVRPVTNSPNDSILISELDDSNSNDGLMFNTKMTCVSSDHSNKNINVNSNHDQTHHQPTAISSFKSQNLENLSDVTFPLNSLKNGNIVTVAHPRKSSKFSSIKGNVLNVDGLEGKLNRGILAYEMSDGDFNVFLETRTDNPNFENTALCDNTTFVKT